MAGFPPLPVPQHSFMVSLLGGFRLHWNGSLHAGIPRASQRLLAFLALHEGIVNRDAVAGTLWPDSSERQAYANLRSALTRLSVGRQALTTSKLEIGLAQDAIVDLRQARQLARRLLDPAAAIEVGELGTAVLVLSLDLLPGWYDDWALIEAENWRQLRLHSLEALARRLLANGRLGEAAEAASAAVRAEPLRETARAALIEVHLTEGNQWEAVREYERYRTLLRAELELNPTVRLRRLMQGLRGR